MNTLSVLRAGADSQQPVHVMQFALDALLKCGHLLVDEANISRVPEFDVAVDGLRKAIAEAGASAGSELDQLLRRARLRPLMSTDDLFEQRVSWVYSMLSDDSRAKLSREAFAEQLRQHDGVPSRVGSGHA